MAKAKKSVKKSAKKAARKATPKAPSSIKTVLTKSALVAHLAEAAQVAAKDVRAVLASLEHTIRRLDQQEGPSYLHAAGTAEDHRHQRAGKEAAQRHQPVHGSGNHLYCQACDREGQGASDEEAEGRRQGLRPYQR